MKKEHIILFVIFLILIGLGLIASKEKMSKAPASTSIESTQESRSTLESDNDQDKVVIPDGISPADVTNTNYQLAEVGGHASCFSYELQDGDGNKVWVDEAADQALDCRSGGDLLSPDKRYFTYTTFNEVSGHIEFMLYDLSKQLPSKMMSFLVYDGITCMWNEPSTRMACLVVNQEHYEASTKIFVYDIQDGLLQKKRIYPQPVGEPVEFFCASTCSPALEDSFQFTAENEIIYRIKEFDEEGNRKDPSRFVKIQL